jgi:hypothetical protein
MFFLNRFLSIALLIIVCAASIHAQKNTLLKKSQDENADYVVDTDTYSRVLDLVFPRDVLIGSWGYAFVLRYEPTFDTESQITIINKAGNIEVIEYTPVGGNVRLQLKKILPHVGDLNAEEAAKRIQMRRRFISIPRGRVKQIRESFYNHISLAARFEKERISENIKSVDALLDATQYLLWYRGQGDARFTLYGSDINVVSLTKEHPLINWMKDVKRIISRLPVDSNAKP